MALFSKALRSELSHYRRRKTISLDGTVGGMDQGVEMDEELADAQYTGEKDVTGRLQELLLDEGIIAEVLKATVDPEKREEWLKEKVEGGADVVIANPRLVQTGLDLYDFPTLAFYQTGYSIFTLRQASRRSWRIGQRQPVRVNYLYYRPTMQERAMHLMGSKLEASLAIEGKFSEDGLLALPQGEDMATAPAKAPLRSPRGLGRTLSVSSTGRLPMGRMMQSEHQAPGDFVDRHFSAAYTASESLPCRGSGYGPPELPYEPLAGGQ